MTNLGEIAGGAAAAALSGLGAWHMARGILALRGKRLVTCPETGQPVAVDLDLPYSAVHSALGRPHFRLKDCTRWPARAGCGQTCLGDLEAAPHGCLVRTILAEWYAGQQCAFCRRAFGEIQWHDHKPALLDADGISREWTEIPPETVPEVLSTQRPVCWNCHTAETFRRVHADLVVERPPRPAAQA